MSDIEFKIKLAKMARHLPGEEWRVRAERDGKDYNAVGSTPEQAMDRLIAFMRGRFAFDLPATKKEDVDGNG